jgi:mannose-6-phosphate isomerase-like protein (cupin superfamily)
VLSREAVRARLGEGKGAIPLGSGSEYSAVVARVTDLLPGHLHRERTEVVVVLAGSGKITVGGTKSALAPGTVVYIPPGVYHDVTPGPGGVDAVIVRIPPTGDEDTVPVR